MHFKSCLALLVVALSSFILSCADFHRGPAPLAGGTDAAQVSDSMFEKLVYPILDSNCRECHAAGREASASRLVLTGNFFLDRFEVVALVIPGNPTSSELLIQQTLDTHPGGQRLAPDSLEYQTVALWIQGLDSTAK